MIVVCVFNMENNVENLRTVGGVAAASVQQITGIQTNKHI